MVQNDSQINTHVFVMVNGEGPSVPITTLACIQSLTDLPLELPLPTPLPGVTGHQSLLSHLRDSEEARRLLNTPDSIIIPPLIDALDRTTIDHIEVKDGYYAGGSHSGKKSQLVQYLLGRNPSLFKGSVHGTQSGDHHVSSRQWLRKECSNMSVHHQQTAFNAPAVSPCEPHQTQGNSLNYYPLDHPPITPTAKIVQNKTQNMAPKSFLTYSPYDHSVAPSGQQHSVPIHNTISQDAGDSLSSGLQETPQILNSLINVPLPSPAVHLFSNGNCVDEVDLSAVSTKQNDRTENHILETSQVTNVVPNCCPVINDISISLPSSSTRQHVNSSSVTIESSVSHVNCMKKRAVEQWQSVINNSFEISQSDTSIKENINSIHDSESTLQLLSVPGSESRNETDNKLEEKYKNENTSEPGVISKKRRVSATEPVVVLSKLSLKDQLLKKSQKCVHQDTIKSKITGSSPEPVKESVPDKASKISNHRRSSTCIETTTTLQSNSSCAIVSGPSSAPENYKKCLVEQWQSEPNNSSENSESYTHVKENVNNIHNSELTLQTLTVPGSEQNKETVVYNKSKKKVKNENSSKPAMISEKRRLLSTEPVVVLSPLSLEDQLLAQKSVHQLTIKSKKTGSSPESVKVSVQNKVLGKNKQSRSSTHKDPDLSNKFSRKKDMNDEHFPQTIEETSSSEPVKVSVKKKVSENSNCHRSSTCKKSDLNHKSLQRKDRQIDSSPESVKVSVQNKVEKNSDCRRSSTRKEPDLNNKSPQRKTRKTYATPESVKVSIQDKISKNSNRHRSSTNEEPDLSNKSPQRKSRKVDSSPESVKVSVQNKVSKNSNRSSTNKELDLNNKSSQGKSRKIDSSPESTVSIQDKILENSNCRRSSTSNEPDLSNKSPHKKNREIDSTPETIKVSIQNKVLDNSNHRNSSTHAESGLSNKFPQKGRKIDSSPESVKISVLDKISGNVNHRRSFTCKEPDLSNKSSQRKSRKTHSSTESIDVSVQNSKNSNNRRSSTHKELDLSSKSSQRRKLDSSPEPEKISVPNKLAETSDHCRSSTRKEPDIKNKSSRKDRKTDSSPESVKISIQDKISRNSNNRRPSTRKEPSLNNKTSQRRKTDSSPESVKISSQEKPSKTSNCHHSSTRKEPDLNNKSPRRKSRKTDSSPESVKISVQDKVSKNSNHHCSRNKEPDLNNKSSQRKSRETDSSPESVMVSVQDKVLENSNCRRSSTSKEPDINNKSAQRKSRKIDSSVESIKVSAQNKVPENSNRHHSSISKESELRNKSPQRKSRKTDSSPESVKVSAQNKVSGNSNRHHSAINKEPDLRNKSPQRKSRKADASPVSLKIVMENKVSENSNHHRSSTSKEPDISNKSPQRKSRKIDSSPESVKVSIQNKISENCKRRLSSTSKEPDLSNVSSKKQSNNNEYFPQTIKDNESGSSKKLEKSDQNEVLEISNCRKETHISNKSPQEKVCNNEYFPNMKSSKLVREKGLKRTLVSSSEEINKTSKPDTKVKKRCRQSSRPNYIKSSDSEDEIHKSYRKEYIEKPMVLSSPKMKTSQSKKISTIDPIIILTKLSLKDQLLAQKSVRQFIIKCKATGRYKPIKLRQRKDHHNEYFFPYRNNSLLKKEKGIKKSLNSSLEKLNKSSTSNDRAGKKHRINSQRTYIESSNSEDEKSDESYKEESAEEVVSSISKSKKLNKKSKAYLVPEPLSMEDLMDSSTYQHFSRTVDVIFDSMDGIDFSAVNEEDEECAAETLIPLVQLQELRNEAAKLKRLHAMNQFPPERLLRLLAILERNIIDGTNLLPVQMLEEQDEDEERLLLELTMERIIRSADAALTALYIMTSPKMQEKVFLEDVIERIVVYLKYQLQNTVFPVFDPAYRLNPKSKTGYAGNIKQKRAHAHKVKEKSFIKLYNKLHEALSLFAELLNLQTVTDTIILHVSTLGVSPFFVEGINELQLSALRLVTSVFARYDKHRSLILEDILSSIARLPTSKRSLRNYRLNSEENIQMLTALVLQLIHSVIRLPESKNDSKSEFTSNEEKSRDSEIKEKVYIDKDILIITSYEASMQTAVGFLSVFLKKCGAKNEEMDYRPLFENFVQDLLSTVNKPEWPASELLLSVLGRMLVRNFSNKSMEMTLRVASLDYLGVVAARLRKDAVTSQDRQDRINDIIQRIVTDSDDDDSSATKSKKQRKKKPVKCDETQILQKTLLQYLDSNAANDPALLFSRRFYIAQWYRDIAIEVKRSDRSLNFPNEETPDRSDTVCNKSKSNRSKKGRRQSSQITYEEQEEEEEEKKEPKLESDEVDTKVLALAEKRKRFLLTVIKQKEPLKVNIKEEKHIDYETAELISHYLASTRHFSKSFDLYLSQILCVLSETAVAVRTKAMKCLTLVVEADPSILARPDMQKGVHGRLLDQSTSVREAAVDLLGKFILIRPELISQYYDMLTARILDTGVSVRKRVIKILKDICLEQPDFPKTPEICVKIIRRVNDEEGIKKLVGEVFQSMWFSPVSDKKQERILQKVKNIAHVVEACRDTGLEWFEQLLTNLLKNKDDSNYKSVVKSCKQIVDCLVENLLQLEESSQNIDGGASSHLVACLTTLHLFSKMYPPFVVPHATTIQPYLSMRCNTQSDFLSLKYVAQTLELVVPLIEHPSDTFLAQIEEDVVKLILQQHMGLLPSCVSCLGSVVNKITHNYQFVKDCFQKFFTVLSVCKKGYEKNPENEMLKTMRPKLLRSLYTVGLFCRYFDFDAIDNGLEQNGQISFKNKVFESIIYFNQHDDEDIRLKALTGLGFIMIRHYEFMLGPEVKTLYHYLLTSSVSSSMLKCQVLKNITNYLVEEEMQMIQKDSEWKELSKSEDLKEMGDVTSGMASTVIQLYLKQILECVLHAEVSCRKASLSVIQLILSQGLVHPVQIVPYLVCLGSDDDLVIQTKADQLLQEIEKKYPGFIQMKAMHGVRMSFKMQQLIQNADEIVRGFRCLETPVSRNGFLYSLMRSTRQSRRAFLCSLMKLFDEQDRTPLTELLYIADNIAYFSYMAQDEPLFIMHQLDIMLSVSGSNLLQTFRETLSYKQLAETSEQNSAHREIDDDDDDDFEAILRRLPETTTILQECIIASQGCILLLYIKQTLKEMYGFTDNKIQQYSPNEAAKVYERPLNRKGHVRFNPETVLNFIKMGQLEGELDDQGKEKLVDEYLNFKQLMLTIDPADDDDDEKDSQTKPDVSTHTVLPVPDSTEKTVVSENAGETKPAQIPLEEAKVVTSRKCKSPTHSRSHRKQTKTPKEKLKKKHKKKRKRILISASEDSASDPDYMDSS